MLAIAAGAKRNQSKTLANTSGGQGFKPMKAANGARMSAALAGPTIRPQSVLRPLSLYSELFSEHATRAD